MADDVDRLVELPWWVQRVKPDAPPVRRKRTLSDRLREAAAARTGGVDVPDDDVIDLADGEQAAIDVDRLRTDA